MKSDKSLWVLEQGSWRPVNMTIPSVAVGSIEIVLVINQLPDTG